MGNKKALDKLILAVIAKCDYGYLVDHALAIDRNVCPLNYACKREYFDLWRPYIESSNSKPKRKKQKTSQLNEEDYEPNEHHNKIRSTIASSTSYIIGLGKQCGYFTEKIHDDLNIEYGMLSGKDDLAHEALSKINQVVEHDRDSPSLVQLQRGWYILPPNTAYLVSDVSCIQSLIDYGRLKGLYDVIVVDPPWYNKSAKRSGKYSFLSLWQIKKLRVPELLNDNGLVIVWVTNKPKYINFTKGELFTDWGIDYVAEWHWVKVTRMGELVVDLDSQHKRPYETIIIGQKKNIQIQAQTLTASTSQSKNDLFEIPAAIEKNIETKGSSQATNKYSSSVPTMPVCKTNCEELKKTENCYEHKISTNGDMTAQGTSIKLNAEVLYNEQNCVGIPVFNEHKQLVNTVSPVKISPDKQDSFSGSVKHRKPIPDHLVICSIPCQLHSRKPPLNDIISDYVGADARCLEMFARNLTTGWTSWGNEVLKFQHVEYFDVKTSTRK